MSQQSARARGLAYANQVMKQSGRRTQPDVFAKKTTGPKTYAFQDQPRDTTDDTAGETKPLRDQEKKVEGDEEKDIVDKTDFTPAQTGGRAPPAQKSTSGPPATQGLQSAFAKCWTTVDTIDIPAKQYRDSSWFLPCAIVIFEVLHSMEELLNRNEELRWISPNYFSLPVRVYYAVIFYVQCLRAKQQAGTIKKSEGSWLRAFERQFKDVHCPIAGPLVPIFSNIVSCLPDDDQYDYVHPEIPHLGTYNVTTTTPATETAARVSKLTVSETHHLFPSVPLIASILKQFCNTREINPTTTFDESGAYVPFLLTTGGTLAGVTFPPHGQGAINAQISALLNNPVISHPLPESRTRLAEILGFWRRSKCRNIPSISSLNDYIPNGIHDQTLMTDSFDWFQPCIDMAQIQTKFFSDSVNLSAIPTVGGMHSLIRSKLHFTDKQVKPTTTNDWYPDSFSSCKASFSSTAAELSLDNKFAAAYALTNSELEWQDENGQRVGTLAIGHKNGPYWQEEGHEKVTFEQEHPVPVINGIYSMIQTQFYDARGQT